MRRLLLTIFLAGMCFDLSFAEGSKNLTPKQDAVSDLQATNDEVGYLVHDAINNLSGNFLNRFASDQEKLYITLKPGETLYYGVQRKSVTYTDDQYPRLWLRLLYLDQTDTEQQAQDVFYLNDATDGNLLDNSQAGVIDDADQALAGPNRTGVTNGYDALSWTNNTGAAVDVWVEFNTTVDIGGTWYYADVQAAYDLWDFTVIDQNGVERTGRLYSSVWGFTTLDYNNRLSREFSFYTLIPSDISGYYVKKANFYGMQPYTAMFVANSEGLDVTGDYTEKRKSRNTFDWSAISPEFRLYVNDPDTELFPTAPANTLTIVDSHSFCNEAGEGQMAMNIYSEQDGVGLVWIDVDQDETFNAVDVLLEQPIVAGNNYFLWDGLDGNGVPVASGREVRLEFRSNIKAVNYPVWDAESNANGLTVQKVRPGINAEYEYLYYDDSLLDPDFSAPLAQLHGDNQPSGAHQWVDPTGDGSGGGNGIITNTFSYGEVNTQIITKTHTYECNPDIDGDGILNDVDADNDDDGISDVEELNGLADPYGFDAGTASGLPRYLDYNLSNWLDLDNNGIHDLYDMDGDGVLDINDTDSDGDNIFDALEANDGVSPSANYESASGTFTGADADSNGMKDTAEGVPGSGTTVLPMPDADSDGQADFKDIDTDNDGIRDELEGITDLDNDGILNYKDTDADGDGAYDFDEAGGTVAATNGVINATTDTNANGLMDVVESANGGTDLTVADHDGDGYLSFLDSDNDNDGIPDAIEGFGDFDNDGIANAYDLDSDNDGIADVIEAGGTDTDGDQRIDGPYNSNGLAQSVDPATGGTALLLPDTDGAGNADYLDADSDGDGISDVLEAGATDSDGDGQIAGPFTINGLAEAYDPASGVQALVLADADTDGTPDYLETDSDNDGFTDATEGFDTDFDGTANTIATGSDTDGDGLDDAFDTNNGGAASEMPDTDGDGLPNYADADDDGDGTASSVEGNGFTQGGGSMPDYLYDVTNDYYQPNGDAVRLGTHDYQLTADVTGSTTAIWAKEPVNSNNLIEVTATLNFGSNNNSGEGIAFVAHNDPAGINAIGTGGSDMGYGGIINSAIIEMDTKTDASHGDPAYDHMGFMVGGDATASVYNVALMDAMGDINDGADHTFRLRYNPANDRLQVRIDGRMIANFVADVNGILGNGDVFWGFTAATGSVSSNLQRVTNITMMSFVDSDGDGIIDEGDIDSDNDGVTDVEEGKGNDPSADANGDGIPNFKDRYYAGFTDVNSDGINDLFDSDLDGVPNHLDLDSDNDGIADVIEIGNSDADNDGRVASPITDTNNDGYHDPLAAIRFANPDSDGDGLANYLDLDSDNDGLTDTFEAGGTDANADGIIDGLAVDANGWDAATAAANLPVTDTDSDGVADFRDLDSDNDGITDIVEAGGGDTNADGRADAFVDNNGNGLNDTLEPSGGTPLTLTDSDSDGLYDFNDLDSDNDGVSDIIEAGGTDFTQDGLIDSFNDTNADGWHDALAGAAWATPDHDADGLANYKDADSDNDGITDVVETSGAAADSDNDGRLDAFSAATDTNSNGFLDNLEYNNVTLSDNDGDNVANYLDIDSDNDGIPDVREAGGTPDADGRILGFAGNDANGDGLHDSPGTSLINTDNDAWADYLDVDSDNDGLTDAIENGFTDDNSDGRVDGFVDSSPSSASDGYHDAIDPTLYTNSDGDAEPNYRDRDSDGDGLQDWIEAFDFDGDGDALNDYMLIAENYLAYNGDNYYPTDAANDSDGDGISDWLEFDPLTGISNFQDPAQASTYYYDSNGDGLVNLYDAAFGGTVYDPERAPDSNGDGQPDWNDSGSAVTLPVELTDFNGWLNNQQQVELNWETASELNNSHFVVERSPDGKQFTAIGAVEGYGTVSTQQFYTYKDRQPEQGSNYYRLKQVDFDGAFAYSDIIVVENQWLSVLEVYPNPFQNTLKLTGVNWDTQQVELYLYDLNGQEILSDQIEPNELEQEIEWSVPVSIPKGIYVLKVQWNNEEYQVRVLKN